MNIQIELWALLTTLGGWLLIFCGGLYAVVKVIGGLVEKRLEEKFKAQEKAREVADTTLNETLARHLAEERAMALQLTNLEKDFLRWQGELPIKYVLREDYIRGQVTLEAKQDASHAETKVVQMQLQKLIGMMEGQKK